MGPVSFLAPCSDHEVILAEAIHYTGKVYTIAASNFVFYLLFPPKYIGLENSPALISNRTILLWKSAGGLAVNFVVLFCWSDCLRTASNVLCLVSPRSHETLATNATVKTLCEAYRNTNEHNSCHWGRDLSLSSAFHLSQRFPQANIRLLEKSSRDGGWIRSQRVEVKDSKGNKADILLEAGPRTLGPNSKSILELVSPFDDGHLPS